LKQRLEKEQGEEFAASGLKFIHSGKILSDDNQTVQQCNIKENEFIVVMTSKPKAAPAKAAAPAAAPASHATAPAPVAAPSAHAPASSAPATSQSSSSAPHGESAPTANPSEDTIAQLVDMGFVRDDVVAALRAAFGNRDRAVEYLSTGNIPMQTDAPAPTPASPASAPSSSSASAPSAPASGSGQSAAASGAPAGGFVLPPTSPLAPLASNPQFIQLRTLVHRQPELLPALLQQLGQHNPQLIQLINDNQEDFYILLNMTASGSGGAGGEGGVPIQVTREEGEAINRLCQLGFDRNLVIQAYFACDKNETLAANFLFQQGGD